jgi:hypothetical protein
MDQKIPEKNKKPGICYAWSDDGLELPVIDITNPAFAFAITDAELEVLVDNMQRAASIPPSVLQSLAQNSILVRGLVESADTYTTGMMTYLNKLGPDNLGDGYAGPLDRQWAASLTPVTFRWRMRDVALLLAESIHSALTSRPASAVTMINIGGGPASDNLNALLLTQKEYPGLLDDRRISIRIFDLDQAGPDFAARSLAALQSPSGPLNGLHAECQYTHYDWSDSALLRKSILDFDLAHEVVVGSSEGGLFEYAADEEIVANLKVLYLDTPEDMVMVGPVVRDAASLDPRLKATEHTPWPACCALPGPGSFRAVGS